MLRQVLYARGFFSKARGSANVSSFKAHVGLLPAGQRRAFHVFPRPRYDDDSSSYGTTSNIDSSYGTSSKSGTGLGSFTSSLSTLGDDTYNSNYTTPSCDSSILARHKTGTKTMKPDNTIEYERLRTELLGQITLTNVGLEGSLSRQHSLLNTTNTKLDIIMEDLETLVRRPSPPPQTTDVARPAWWRREKKEYGSFWESFSPIACGSMVGLALCAALGVAANGHAHRRVENERRIEELKAGKTK